MVDQWPIVEWRQVWINAHNYVRLRVHIVDPLQEGTEFIEGSLHCEAMGSSVTYVCAYNKDARQVEWVGFIGPDAGATTEEAAQNEVVITFRVKVTDPNLTALDNRTSGQWDANGDGAVDFRDQNVAMGLPITALANVHKRPPAQPPTRVTKPILPKTGFSPVETRPRQTQPTQKQPTSDLWLDIPKLGVHAPIFRVRKQGETWDVSWLWTQIGWLEGTAFPTHKGNTVLAGHVTLASGLPGPFDKLSTLRPGDVIHIQAWGREYTYQVRRSFRVAPDDGHVLENKDGTWVTLITCEEYDKEAKTYRWRRVVQAERVGPSRTDVPRMPLPRLEDIR